MTHTLPADAVLSRYRIIERIGAGGMGEVYKAYDSSLERYVALKILPPELVSREDRLQRFVQEAKTASGLSHPNIVTIHEIGHAAVENSSDSAAVHFIAMELVEGETLRKRIHRDRRSLRSLLDLLAQSADGLAKAHAAGVVHRDLKPDNIMVTEDGFAKILDFGLAKLLERSSPLSRGPDEPTQLREKTREGVILGTVGYMSPEQVEGREVDARSDVFSFGCILYEAVTRKKPFAAESEVDVLHKILHDEPESLADLASDAPWELRRIVRRCLAKEPDRRYQSMRDLANELRDLVDDFDQLSPGSGSRSFSGASQAREPLAKRPAMWAAVAGGVVAAVLLAGGFVLTRDSSSPLALMNQMTIRPLTSTGAVIDGVISPDTRFLAYVAEERGKRAVYLRQIATGSEVPVIQPSPTLRVSGLTFSRDGNYLYITSGHAGEPINSLSVVPTLGGTPRPLIRDVDSGAALSPDEKEVAFIRRFPARAESQLIVATIDGSNERIVSTRKGNEFFQFSPPSWSPDGKWIAASGGSSAEGMRTTILLVSADGKETRDLIQRPWFETSSLAWLPDGSGIVMAGMEVEAAIHQIWLFPFPSGEPRRITNDLTSYTSVSVSADGASLVAMAGDRWNRLWKIGPDGERPMTSEGDRNAPARFGLLPDGSVAYQSMASGNLDVWRLMPSGERRKLTSHPRADYMPSVAPGGGLIYFLTERHGAAEIWRMLADGGAEERIATVGADVDVSVSPDGRWIVYPLHGKLWRVSTGGGDPAVLAEIDAAALDHSPDGTMLAGFFRLKPLPSTMELGVMPASGGTPRVIADDEAPVNRPTVRWTPDGRGVAYIRFEEGASNIWVQPLDGGDRVRLTNFDSGYISDFRWNATGENLFVSRGRFLADMVMISDFR
jgi:eukaryotic-like serine/threonine-protein kinase